MGLTKEQLDNLDNYKTSGAYSELERLVLQYTEELTENVDTSTELLDKLKRHLSEQELVELNFVVGLANLTNRFNESFKTDLETS